VLVSLIAGAPGASAQTLTAAASDAAPPDELSPAVKASLGGLSAKVQSGTTTLEFWWVKSLDAAGSGEGWARVAEGSLAGAVRVSEPYPDIRGRRIKPGVYTLRYALQPMNGDHLGVAPHREFLLVCPAAADTAVAPTGYQGTVDLSKQTTGAAHPAVWSLDPPTGATDQPLSAYRNDAGHQGIVFEVGTSSGPIRFGLILIGKIEA
jgi:hypothetical protein